MTSCFDESPEIYERARPLYPEQMWDELFSLLPATPSVLEIGPGTGKATGALLVRGARVVACEPGRNLARYLRNKFDTATLEVRNEGFEASSPDLADYDAVVAATSFHWVDPLVRVRMAHAALRPGGILAVIDTNQVESEADRGYFAASQPIYDRYFPEHPSPAPTLAGRSVIPQAFGEIREAGLFGCPRHRLLERRMQNYQRDDPGCAVNLRSSSSHRDPQALLICSQGRPRVGGRISNGTGRD